MPTTERPFVTRRPNFWRHLAFNLAPYILIVVGVSYWFDGDNIPWDIECLISLVFYALIFDYYLTAVEVTRQIVRGPRNWWIRTITFPLTEVNVEASRVAVAQKSFWQSYEIQAENGQKIVLARSFTPKIFNELLAYIEERQDQIRQAQPVNDPA